MIGQPMDASGFAALAARFPERTVVTYDPRGLGRSVRKDGRADHAPRTRADDVHAVIEAVGAWPVEMFAGSGGAVTALAVVEKYPSDVTTLVAHEPPLITLTPDGPAAVRARAGVREACEERGWGDGGWGAGMAAFVTMASWVDEFTVPNAAESAAGCAKCASPHATFRCCPTGRGRSAATGRTLTRSPSRRPAW